MMLGIFSCAYCHSYVLFCEMFFSNLLPIFKKLNYVLSLSCKSASHHLDKSPLSDICIAHNFSQPVGYIFTLLVVPFQEQLLDFEVKFIFFNFMVCTFCVLSNKSLFYSKSDEDFSMFSSIGFMVLDFKYKIMIHII